MTAEIKGGNYVIVNFNTKVKWDGLISLFVSNCNQLLQGFFFLDSGPPRCWVLGIIFAILLDDVNPIDTTDRTRADRVVNNQTEKIRKNYSLKPRNDTIVYS